MPDKKNNQEKKKIEARKKRPDRRKDERFSARNNTKAIKRGRIR